MCNNCALVKKNKKILKVIRIFHRHPGAGYRRLLESNSSTNYYYKETAQILKIHTSSVDCFNFWFKDIHETELGLAIENLIGAFEYFLLSPREEKKRE